MARTARVFYLTKQFKGEPKASDFELKEEKLPPLKDGEVLVEAEWLSVDPFMRAYLNTSSEGTKLMGDQDARAYNNSHAGIKMIGGQVARVTETKNSNYAIGDLIVGYMGWASHSILNPDLNKKATIEMERMEKFKHTDVSPSYSLGVLGMPGYSAYFGFLEICKPQKGDIVVVSGAAGAVGNIVGQIAKVKGCTVIGFAGSDEKVQWLKKTCKFDFAYNYKTTDVAKALDEAAPQGVNCYFDNVGGTLSSIVLSKMQKQGRVSVCGAIAIYNADMASPPMAPVVQWSIVVQELNIQGFVISRWVDQYAKADSDLYQWLKEGKIVATEKIYEGFENLPGALIGMLRGENTGKAVVRAKKQ